MPTKTTTQHRSLLGPSSEQAIADRVGDDTVARYINTVEWKPTTRANGVNVLGRWAAWLDDRGVAVIDAEDNDLRAMLRERADAGISPSTRRKQWQFIRGLYRWASTPRRAGGGGLLDEDPMVAVKGPHVDESVTTRSARPDEIEAMITALERRVARFGKRSPEQVYALRDIAIVSLMFSTGLRSGEVARARMIDVVPAEDGTWTLLIPKDTAKTNKPRRVPVLAGTRVHLERYLRARRLDDDSVGPLFAGRDGYTASDAGHLKSPAVQRIVRRAADAAQVPVSAHQLRRGWMAASHRAGVDVLTLEILGGWTDHRMPRRYLADQEQDAAVAAFRAKLDGGAKRRNPRLRLVG